MRIAILTTDNREHWRKYDLTTPCFGTAPEALVEGFARMPEVEAHIVCCIQRPMESPAKLADNVWYHSVLVPKVGWLRTLYQGCIRATRRKLREIAPDIVHGQGTERDSAISAAFSGFPNVVTVHGNMVAMAGLHRARFGSFYWLASRLETVTLRKTWGVLCNSAYTEGLAAPRSKRTWRVQHALRPAFLTPPPASGPRPLPVLINVGELSPFKRQREVLAVARNLWKRGLRFQVQFAGSTHRRNPYAVEFLRELAEAEAAGYARHLGTLSIDALIAALDAASALVHFSVEESFGLAVAEGLARNLKLFAGAAGGVVDIASGVEGAELFGLDDSAGLEEAMARWIQAGHPRCATAADTMRERYDPLTVAQRHVEVFREALAGASSRPGRP
jgi:glycosyltransferase involved in cell wall biosynthesis